MNFSIILPTRGRAQLLASLLHSIETNTEDKTKIEVLVAYDFDDHETVRSINSFSYKWLTFHGRTQGDSISRDYQNWLYGKSSGKYIFILNDDVEIVTKSWDVITLEIINKNLTYDKIVYGWVNDSETSNRFGDINFPYSCFPILSRQAVDTLGYVMNEHYGGHSADVHLYQVYKAVNRVIDLSCVVAKHKSHWVGNRGKDGTSFLMEKKSTRTDMIDISNDVKKLQNRIYGII